MEEIWKPIENYETRYEVSSFGNIRRLADVPRVDNRGRVTGRKMRAMVGGVNSFGYRTVILTKDNKARSFKVHRLVAKAFLSNQNERPQVNHINGVKTDNRVENLEWCTNQHNVLHAFKLGLNKVRRGEANNLARITEKDAIFIKRNKGIIPRKELMQQFSLCARAINRIQKGELWSHV